MSEELQQLTPDSPAAMAEAVTEIKTQLARLEDLVQDYLSLVRRVGHIAPTPQDLGAAVMAWAAEAQAPAEARRVTLHLLYHHPAPGCH